MREPRVFKISLAGISVTTESDWQNIKEFARTNMTNRDYPEINDLSYNELLVFASRAAGIPLEEFGDIENGEYWIDERGTWWNPLELDEDAYRLMVNLKLRINYDTVIGYDVVEVLGPEQDDLSCDCTTYTIEGDQCASVRRAIVHAAAKIGQRLVDNK